jgi:aminopeptidase N/puromycin-sensitive aminopeptidase
MQARVSGLPVDRVMQGFVDQPGVPLLTIGGVGMSAPVTQRRFSISGSPIAAETWTIPVCFKGEPCRLLGPGQTTLDVPVTNSDDPFISANAADKGYYRTAYAVEEWKPIVANAEKRLTPPERIGLLGDRWALMRAGQGSVGEFLDLALAVEQDPNAAVMESALGRVGTIESRIATDADRERLEGVVRREWGPVYAALGGLQKHESYDRAELRETLFEALGDARDPAVLAEAQSMAKQLFAGQKLADPTMADAAVALATANGDVDMYERLQQVSQTATDPDLKVAALHALTGFQAPALVKRTLEYAVSDDVRGQDSWILISLLLQSRETQDQAWEFVEQHWEEIERKSTAGSGARIVAAAGSFCTVEKRDAVSSFFQQHRVGSSRRALARSIDSINDCIRLRAAQEPELRRWLSAHGGP